MSLGNGEERSCGSSLGSKYTSYMGGREMGEFSDNMCPGLKDHILFFSEKLSSNLHLSSRNQKPGLPSFDLFALFTMTIFSKRCLSLTPDGFALLEMRTLLNDTKNVLSNWNDMDESPSTYLIWNLEELYLPALVNSPDCRDWHFMKTVCVIPNEIGNCPELRAIYLRANYLQGGIPSDIGNLSMLTILDLSSNSLRGAIPSSLGRLRHYLLNLSTNFFSGEIPEVGVLSTFSNKSFIGNLDLCGQQILKPCRTSMGFPVVLPHAESVRLQVWLSLSKKERAPAKNTVKQSLQRAKMVMNDCGTFAVKRIDRSREGSESLKRVGNLGSLDNFLHAYTHDENLEPRVQTFGLAKYLFGGREAHVTTVVAVLAKWKSHRESDVYSFGVLLLELTGKKANRSILREPRA
ncbi:hypothetical protein HAX54_051620 [Datura stramonium]|uniref:Uncharacterized protein n=1 Tax=Datura stramonium TaxID=4076 RepID=A0ABS8WRK1_DATST|nr:hypothetical protein [Datura stramonium]